MSLLAPSTSCTIYSSRDSSVLYLCSGRAPDGGCGKRRTYHHPRDCTGGRTRPRHGGLERHCYGMFPALVCDCVAGVGCEPADGKASDCRMTRRVLHSFAFFANEFTWACGPPMGMK